MPRPSTSTSSYSRRRRAVASSSDESNDGDDDGDFNPVGNSTKFNFTQRDKEANDIANHEVLVNNMVKMMLSYSTTKVPIKRGDFSKTLNITPKAFQEVFDEAQAKLEKVYGLTVDEIEGKNQKTYIVHSVLEKNPSAEQHPQKQRDNITLLFIILSYIFMKGGEIQEGEIFIFLCNS